MDPLLKLAYILGIVVLVVLLPLAGFRSALGLGRFLLACVVMFSLIAGVLFAVKLAVAGMEGRPADGAREYWINAGVSALLVLQFAALGRIARRISAWEASAGTWSGFRVFGIVAVTYLIFFTAHRMNLYI